MHARLGPQYEWDVRFPGENRDTQSVAACVTTRDVLLPSALHLPQPVGRFRPLAREKQLAFCMALHARLGAACPAFRLAGELIKKIIAKASVRPLGSSCPYKCKCALCKCALCVHG